MRFTMGAVASVIAVVAATADMKARNLEAPDVEKLKEYKDPK